MRPVGVDGPVVPHVGPPSPPPHDAARPVPVAAVGRPGPVVARLGQVVAPPVAGAVAARPPHTVGREEVVGGADPSGPCLGVVGRHTQVDVAPVPKDVARPALEVRVVATVPVAHRRRVNVEVRPAKVRPRRRVVLGLVAVLAVAAPPTRRVRRALDGAGDGLGADEVPLVRPPDGLVVVEVAVVSPASLSPVAHKVVPALGRVGDPHAMVAQVVVLGVVDVGDVVGALGLGGGVEVVHIIHRRPVVEPPPNGVAAPGRGTRPAPPVVVLLEEALVDEVATGEVAPPSAVVPVPPAPA